MQSHHGRRNNAHQQQSLQFNRARHRPPIIRCSIRWAMIFLGILVILSLLLFLLLFHWLHLQDANYNHRHGGHPQASEHTVSTERQNPSSSSSYLSVQQYLQDTINRTSLPLTAFVEETIPFSQSQQHQAFSPRHANNRTSSLKKYIYPKITSCNDIPNQWPVDHPVEWDETFGPNVGNLKAIYPLRYQYAKQFCPVDADPFLPWIHDVFVNLGLSHVEFVAHNKRRCKTAPSFRDTDLKNLEPQVALFQSIPIKRLDSAELSRLLPESDVSPGPRYRLASLEEADEDTRETRFICQFHTLEPVQREDGRESYEKVVLGETFSVYPYNYEHANYRKGPKPHPLLTTPKDDQDVHGAHNEQIWNSVLHFSCPIPPDMRPRITKDWDHGSIPSIYVDLVPIRTKPRETREGYCPQLASISTFDPHKEWGHDYVLPLVEDSGRWANIPLCPAQAFDIPRTVTTSIPKKVTHNAEIATSSTTKSKPHYLVGCLWASAAFKTRGNGAVLDTSTSTRLLEWLTFHLYIANFDHVYVYDNSQANTNETSLGPIIRLFPTDRVTRISWKHRVCNNNRPAHQNAGERSSQYAAETSCRIRYGQSTEWMIFFDTDEFLIPAGNWTDLQEWLKSSVASGSIGPHTNILSFFQSRAAPNIAYMEPYIDVGDSNHVKCGVDEEGDSHCLAKRDGVPFLRAYDCESSPLPKPDHGWRAKKQIYRPSFVLNHFVHYTTVTTRIHEAPNEASPPFQQRKPYERRVDEINEAFMLHTKTTDSTATAGWKEHCRDTENAKDCPVGIAWPLLPGGGDEVDKSAKLSKDGLAYNCYQHGRIQHAFAGQLEKLLKPLKGQLEGKKTV